MLLGHLLVALAGLLVVDVVVVVAAAVAIALVRFFVSAPGKDNQFCDRTT